MQCFCTNEQEEIRELNVTLWPTKLSLRGGSIPNVGSEWGLEKWKKCGRFQ